jgi:hypothetical protein
MVRGKDRRFLDGARFARFQLSLADGRMSAYKAVS